MGVDRREICFEETSVTASLTVHSFLFGVASYAVTFGLYSALGKDFGVEVDIGSEDGDLNLAGLADEIISAVATALILSIIWVYAATYKILQDSCL